MAQQGATDSSKAPGSAAVTLEPVWLQQHASGQYGFTTVRADAEAAFGLDAASGQYGPDTATTVHTPKVRLRSGSILAYTTS